MLVLLDQGAILSLERPQLRQGPISAKVSAETGKPLEGASEGNPITGGISCAAYIGENGAGHYVKMVHNGIEYGDMQMICEAYHLMTDLLGMTAKEVGDTFSIWNQGELDSFLMEISADALQQKDPRRAMQGLPAYLRPDDDDHREQ